MIFILPAITLLLFLVNVFYRGNNVQSCILFVLTLLPLMDLKVTPEAMGGFKTFDIICFYCVIFLIRDFITIDLSGRNNLYFVMFLLMAVIFLLGGLSSEFPDRTYLKLFKFLPIFIFARFFLTEVYKDPLFLQRAIQALKVSYLTALSFLLVQWIVGLKFTFYPGLHPNTVDPIYHIIRYPGVFYDSQASGQYLAMGSFLFLYVEEGSSRKIHIFNYTVFVLSIVAINLAGSRSAFGGFAVGVLIAFFMAARKYRIYGAVALIAAYLIFTGVSLHTGVFDRTENLSEDFLFRQSIWKKAFEISQKHPYLGIGSGNYQNYVTRHVQDQYLEIEDGQLVYFDQPENGYLKIMVELGFIGFAIFMLYLLVPLVKGFIANIRGQVDSQIAFFMASLVSWILAFNTVYSIYDYRLLIVVTSMIVLIISYPEKEYYYELAENQQV